MSTLSRLEGVTSFSEFIKTFELYGTQMVDLAHLTGDRQNVNKNYILNFTSFFSRFRT